MFREAISSLDGEGFIKATNLLLPWLFFLQLMTAGKLHLALRWIFILDVLPMHTLVHNRWLLSIKVLVLTLSSTKCSAYWIPMESIFLRNAAMGEEALLHDLPVRISISNLSHSSSIRLWNPIVFVSRCAFSSRHWFESVFLFWSHCNN